jgi:hypothetical protein
MNLRKLTRKSILGFGKYQDISVQQCLDLRHHRYLRWVYFNMSQIDFFDDILEEIGCIDYKIVKPSKAPETADYLEKLAEMRIGGINRLKRDSRVKKINKAVKVSSYYSTQNYLFKKETLRSKNQNK